MESGKIVILCIVSAVIYGILHDQVTVRVCVEYFTIGHRPVFSTNSPTLLALGWGTIATWWVGLLLGIPVAFASRLGTWPQYDAARLARPVLCLLVVIGLASFAAGLTGYFVARAGAVWLVEPLRSQVPEAKHTAFLADLWAHLAAYGIGFLGGLTICGWVLFRRWHLARKLDGMSRSTHIMLTLSQFRRLLLSMKYQLITLLLLAGIAGLFWSLGSKIHFAMTHFIAPPLFGLLVAFLFRSFSWERQLLILTTVLAVSEIVRLITYCIVGNGWRYISSDGETQFVMMFSVATQSVIAWLFWLVSRILIHRTGIQADKSQKEDS